MSEPYWPPLSLELWTPDRSEGYDSIEHEINGLEFSTAAGLGFSTALFDVRRHPQFWYEDLQPRNQVVIRSGLDVVWEGRIFNPGLSATSDVSLPIECVGFSNELSSRWSTATFGNSTAGSTWILANLLTDEDLELGEGEVVTEDYVYPYGFDLSPQTYYIEVLDRINRANNYEVAIWEDKNFFYRPKGDTPDYVVRVEDGEVDLSRAIEGVENYLRVSYTADGNIFKYFNWPTAGPDEDSAALYGRRDGTLAIQGNCSLAMAQQIAEVVLEERKRIKPNTNFVAMKVWDAETGIEVNPAKVRAHKVVYIENLYPTQITGYTKTIVDELSTFEVAETTYNCEDRRVTMSPGGVGLMAEKILAKQEAKTKI
jgi:hypothetical protein